MWWRAAAVCSAAMEALRLHDAVVFLATAGVVIPIVKRFSVNPVLGFLLIGIALGPHGLARFANEQTWLRHVLITDVAGVRALAELGVVFLLFMIGLELSLARLWAMRRLVFGLGTAQVVVTALVIGVVARAFGNSLEAAAVLGACLALSSTAVVMALSSTYAPTDSWPRVTAQPDAVTSTMEASAAAKVKRVLKRFVMV